MRAQIELLVNAMERLRDLVRSEVVNVDEEIDVNQQMDSTVSQVNQLTLAAKLHGCAVELDPPTQRE